MKKIKLQSIILAILVAMAMLLSACGSAHTCTSCGRNFRGNAYAGVFPGTVMHAACARQYWHPMDISNFRIRN